MATENPEGLSLGARITWRSGVNQKPSVSLLLGSPPSSSRTPILAYRDEFQLARGLRLGGELAADGSLFLKGSLQTNRYSGFGFYRSGREQTLNSAVLSSLTIWGGASGTMAVSVVPAAAARSTTGAAFPSASRSGRVSI